MGEKKFYEKKLAFEGGLGWNAFAVCNFCRQFFIIGRLFVYLFSVKLAFLGCFACRFAGRSFFF